MEKAMRWPISMSGAVAVADVGVEHAVGCLERALRRANAVALQREGSVIRFRGGALRIVSNWNVLVPVSEGVLEVSREPDGIRIDYRLTFTQMLVLVTLVVGAFFGPAVMRSPRVSPIGGLAILAFMWIWLVAGNLVLTRWRFRSFLLRSLSNPVG